jgi:hypothetical protein
LIKRAGRTFTHALTLSRRSQIDAFSGEIIVEIPQADRDDLDEALAIEGLIVCNQVPARVISNSATMKRIGSIGRFTGAPNPTVCR